MQNFLIRFDPDQFFPGCEDLAQLSVSFRCPLLHYARRSTAGKFCHNATYDFETSLLPAKTSSEAETQQNYRQYT